MTQFFLDCPAYIPTDKNPGLAKSYMKLMVEIWHKNRLADGCLLFASVDSCTVLVLPTMLYLELCTTTVYNNDRLTAFDPGQPG